MNERSAPRGRGAAARLDAACVFARARRRARSCTLRSSAIRSGTTSAAAPVGVGARTSATKSQIVKSVSCPTPETTGKTRVEHRTRDDLLVECPQILERAAAAADDQHVDIGVRVRAPDRCGDLARSTGPWTDAGYRTTGIAGNRRRERRQHIAQCRCPCAT